MTPDQIRRARKIQKLLQREAARIFGGGPNAFQIYEARDVFVSKAADTALRLLSNRPERLAGISGEAHMA